MMRREDEMQERKGSQEERDEFLAKARSRAKYAREAWEENYRQMDEDIEFLHGENQWPKEIRDSRKDRPCLTFNKLPAILDQVVGDQRQMRPSIAVYPTQGNVEGAQGRVPNYAGTKDYSLAEVYEGIIRNIEYSSAADMAYDTAFEGCAGWGLGFFRILTDYADQGSFDQEFKIQRVKNYKSVLIDPDFDQPDGSDIEYAFIFTKLHKDEFEDKYPDAKPCDVDVSDDAFAMWVDDDYVYVAEYYYLEERTYTIHQMSNGEVYDGDKLEPIADELAARGIVSVRQREVQGRRCMWAKISANDILDEKETIFDWIPVIPVLGKELVVNGTPYYRGVIRHSKDAQRMYNFSRTADVERTALIPKAPYIIARQQVEGYESMWGQANQTNYSYLEYEHVDGIPKPGREPPVTGNPGERVLAMQAADDIKATSGIYDASLGARSNETSGIAIRARQREGDVGTYAFVDNMVRSIRHAGRILVNAIPKLYDTERLIRIRFTDDTEDFVEINKTVIDEETGEKVIINDLSAARFDVVVNAGPSYSTQRAEALDAMVQLLQAAPDLWKVIGDLVATNMDWPGASEFAKRLKKMIPPEILDENNQEVDPQQVAMLVQQGVEAQLSEGEAQAQMAKNEAEMAKAEAAKATAAADMVQAEAKRAEAEAKMAELANGIGNGIDDERMRDMVADLIAEFIADSRQANQPANGL